MNLPELSTDEYRRFRVLPMEFFPAHTRRRINQAVERGRPKRYADQGNESRAWFEWHVRRTGRDPRAARPRIPASLRLLVIARDGLVCKLCGSPVDRADVHIDHIRPVAAGGATVLGNLQVAHSLCNVRKGARWKP